MSEQDLSLLTDEEREARAVAASDAQWAADVLADALIAARAENKRLRGGLLAIANADFGKVLELVGAPFVSSGDKYKSAEDFETAGDYSTDARYIRPAREQAISAAARALLQSEKERCPVHDFELPCLGCAELALHVGVDEQEQSEKGGE